MLSRFPFPNDSELFHIICSACEFENVKVRAEEIDEMDELKFLEKAKELEQRAVQLTFVDVERER